MRLSILPLLPNGHCALPLLGFSRWPRANCLRVILSRSLCLYHTYGAPTHASRLTFSHTLIIDIVSTMWVQILTHAWQALIHFVCHVLSYSDVAYIRVFWEEKNGPRCSLNYLPNSCWRYDLGNEPTLSPSVSKTLFFEVYSWLLDEIVVPLLFMIQRTGCFAISDLPTFDLAAAVKEGQGIAIQIPLAYHMGVRLGLWFAYPINYTDIISIISWLR
jgi:hypothetical protein